MPTPEEARTALTLVTNAAVREIVALTNATASIDDLLEATPTVIAYFSDGTAALAADHYDDLREAVNPATRYRAEPVVNLRDEKIRRGVLWATETLLTPEPDPTLVSTRLADVVQLETARPFRDTITANQTRDPASVGWRRHWSGDGCKFCRMLADGAAVYKRDTARFAAHPNCNCSASPVFDSEPAPEASVIQYVASKRNRTPSERARLRAYLATLPD